MCCLKKRVRLASSKIAESENEKDIDSFVDALIVFAWCRRLRRANDRSQRVVSEIQFQIAAKGIGIVARANREDSYTSKKPSHNEKRNRSRSCETRRERRQKKILKKGRKCIKNTFRHSIRSAFQNLKRSWCRRN